MTSSEESYLSTFSSTSSLSRPTSASSCAPQDKKADKSKEQLFHPGSRWSDWESDGEDGMQYENQMGYDMMQAPTFEDEVGSAVMTQEWDLPTPEPEMEEWALPLALPTPEPETTLSFREKVQVDKATSQKDQASFPTWSSTQIGDRASYADERFRNRTGQRHEDRPSESNWVGRNRTGQRYEHLRVSDQCLQCSAYVNSTGFKCFSCWSSSKEQATSMEREPVQDLQPAPCYEWKPKFVQQPHVAGGMQDERIPKFLRQAPPAEESGMQEQATSMERKPVQDLQPALRYEWKPKFVQQPHVAGGMQDGRIPKFLRQAPPAEESGMQESSARYGDAHVRPSRREFKHGLVPKKLNFEAKQQKADGGKPPTTMMIRTIPNKYSRNELIQEIVSLGFGGTFDFFYSPIDNGSMGNVGYAFVNFRSPEWASKCHEVLHGYIFKYYQKGSRQKVAQVSVAHMQGLEANLKHYKMAAVSKQQGQAKWRGPVVMNHRGVLEEV